MKSSHPELILIPATLPGAPSKTKASVKAPPAVNGPKVYTVRELTRDIRNLIETAFPGVWIEGEVSGFKNHHSGHMYFNLKDGEAVLKAVFFSRFNRGLKFDLKDGQQVLCFGKISVYEARGDYQIYVERIEPKGVGALQLALMQLKEKLAKEGFFDEARKRPVPRFPKTVGVITSPTGAAIRDILHVVNRRFRGTSILICPVKVQGDGAAEEISRAIEEMNQCTEIDVLIVGRGGGSLEDLWAFNEEIVARAVFGSRIPIISAVGHEIDWTICDLVADLRAATPSAAAELVVQNREELEIRLDSLSARLKNSVKGLFEENKLALETLQESYAFKQPLHLINQFSQRLDEMLRQLQNYLRNLIREKDQTFRGWAARLESLSPLAILGRGYSLSFNEKGILLKEARQLKPGETMLTRLFKGQVYSKVERIEKGEDEKP